MGTATDNLRTFTTSNQRVYNGVDLQVMARIRSGGFVLAGLTTDKLSTTSCDVRDNPNNLRFCDPATPFRTVQSVGFVSAAVGLPGERELYRPAGRQRLGELHRDQRIAGRPIIGSTAGATQISVNLIEPNTMFRDYIHQLDTRFAKTSASDAIACRRWWTSTTSSISAQ